MLLMRTVTVDFDEYSENVTVDGHPENIEAVNKIYQGLTSMLNTTSYKDVIEKTNIVMENLGMDDVNRTQTAVSIVMETKGL